MSVKNTHIVPQHYLKNFKNENNRIFTYPDPHYGTQGRSSGKTVKKTAVREYFYDDETEKYLSRIENDGKLVLYKILEHKPVSTSERNIFAQYVASFLHRVPLTKVRLAKHSLEVEQQFRKPEMYLKFKKRNPNLSVQQYFAILDKPGWQSEMINQVWIDLISNKHPRVRNVLVTKHWWVLETNAELFITSDNPFYFSPSTGMSGKVQLTFPLSKTMAMIFDNSKDASTEIEYVTSKDLLAHNVLEINRRTASEAEELYTPHRNPILQELLGTTLTNPIDIMK